MEFGKNKMNHSFTSSIVLFFGGRCINQFFFCRHSFGKLGEATPLKTMLGETLIYVKLINPFSVAPGFSIPLRLREMVAVLFSN